MIAAPLIVTAFSAALFGGLLSPAITYGFERMSEYEIKWPEFTRKTSKSGAAEARDCRFYLTTRLVQSCDADIIINDLQLFWQTFFPPPPLPPSPLNCQAHMCNNVHSPPVVQKLNSELVDGRQVESPAILMAGHSGGGWEGGEAAGECTGGRHHHQPHQQNSLSHVLAVRDWIHALERRKEDGGGWRDDRTNQRPHHDKGRD